MHFYFIIIIIVVVVAVVVVVVVIKFYVAQYPFFVRAGSVLHFTCSLENHLDFSRKVFSRAGKCSSKTNHTEIHRCP